MTRSARILAGGRTGGAARSALAAAVLALGLVLLLAAVAAAQSFGDYGLVGGAAPQGEASGPAEPRLEDYGRLAGAYRSQSALDATQRGVSAFRSGLAALLGRAPDMPEDLRATLARASPTGQPGYFAGVAAFLLFLIGIGRAAAVLFAAYAARPFFVGMQRPDPRGLREKLPVLAARVALTVAGIAIVVATAALVGAGFYPEDDEAAVAAAIAVFGAYAAIRVADTLARMALAPYLPEYRVPALSDEDARRLYRWFYAVATPLIAALAGLAWLSTIGAPADAVTLLRTGVELVAAVAVGAGALINRHAITGAILGGRAPKDASWLARGFALVWAPALLAYLAATWLAGLGRAALGAEAPLSPLPVAFVVVIAALSVYAAIMYAVERLAHRAPPRPNAGAAAAPAPAATMAASEGGELGAPPALAVRDPLADGGPMGGDDDEGGGPAPAIRADGGPPPAGMRTFEDLARRVATLFAIGSALWALIWLRGGAAAFEDGRPLDVAQDVADILFVGYVLYHAARIWIDRRIEAEGGYEVETEPGDEGGATAASRLATLLPLVRHFVLILIAASTALFAAMELGVNVAPLLGGAGVIGLAIGFGSQALIRDILSGAFFLIDDAFRKGEYIDVGGVKGTVEQISVRSFQLRHHLGALHTIPFGEIKHLTNFSRDWVMMKLPLRLTYDTDPEKVRKLIKKLGQELLSHPEEGHKFMQPLKSQGVYMMEDSAMIIRVKYMTRPGDQWTTRKLVYSKIRELFEREGIRFAHREVTVRIPDIDAGRPLDARQAQAVGAAARRAVDDADLEAAALPRAVGDDR